MIEQGGGFHSSLFVPNFLFIVPNVLPPNLQWTSWVKEGKGTTSLVDDTDQPSVQCTGNSLGRAGRLAILNALRLGYKRYWDWEVVHPGQLFIFMTFLKLNNFINYHDNYICLNLQYNTQDKINIDHIIILHFGRWSYGSLPGTEEELRCEPIKLEQCSIYKNYESTGLISAIFTKNPYPWYHMIWFTGTILSNTIPAPQGVY